MGRFFLLIFGLTLSTATLVSAQDTLSRKNFISINALQPYLRDIQIHYERKVNSRIGLEFGLGYIIPKKDSSEYLNKESNGLKDYDRMYFIGFAKGYYADFSIKRYLTGRKGSYISAGIFYRNWNYTDKIIRSSVGLSIHEDNYTVKGSANIQVLGLKFLFGSQMIQLNRLLCDVYVGLGVRYKSIFMDNEYFHGGYHGYNSDIPYQFKKYVIRPSVQMGVKIGLAW